MSTEFTRLGIALVAALPLFALTLIATGCPRASEDPEARGEPCTVSAQCNAADAGTCGPRRACVHERCELEPSLIVPCP